MHGRNGPSLHLRQRHARHVDHHLNQIWNLAGSTTFPPHKQHGRPFQLLLTIIRTKLSFFDTFVSKLMRVRTAFSTAFDDHPNKTVLF
jgi:hypothetical protein